MKQLLLVVLVGSIACAQTRLSTPVTILKKANGSAGGTLGILGLTNQLNAGENYINSLIGNVPGAIAWELGQSSGLGLLRLSDGSGAGGCDGLGALIFLKAETGSGCISSLLTVGLTSSPQSQVGPGTVVTNNNNQFVSIGNPATNTAMLITDSNTNYTTKFGGDFIFSQNGTPNTVWALGTSSGKGVFRLADGTGSGGWDSIGSTIYCQAASGLCQMDAVQATTSYSEAFKVAQTGTSFGTSYTLAMNGSATVELKDPGSTIRMSWSSNSGGQVVAGGTFIPNGTFDLGTSVNPWSKLWITTINANGSNGLSQTVTVRDAAGTGTCTLIFVAGIKTGGTC